MKINLELTKKQKESIGILQIGTFLEYFDLLLYVHMAVLLNELFFPKMDPHTQALLGAFAFCSTYVMAPVGALIFGYVGDKYGRKTVIIITTFMMAISCLVLANLPTYSQIGITATYLITICRMLQGMAASSEATGAQIFISEITKPPIQYVAVSTVGISSSIGACAALGVASLVTSSEMGWRTAFWIGAVVAVIGAIARFRLSETPEFLQMKLHENQLLKKSLTRFQRKTAKKTMWAYFLIYCGCPLTFYLAFMYFSPVLIKLGYTPERVIAHNFVLCIFATLISCFFATMGYKIRPLRILRARGLGSLALAIILPLSISNISKPMDVFFLQLLILFVGMEPLPADAIFIKYFPVLKRFKSAALLGSLRMIFMFAGTSFGFVYLTKSMGHWGLGVIIIPVSLGFLWGVRYFKKLEKRKVYEDNNLALAA
ncbi:MAG: MFS transporter [Proteobacteria bacterium]|nr:MFS transporter [Pseudomonadota bacterium]